MNRPAVRLLLAELALYVVAAWLTYELAKTPEQRLHDRLRAYSALARCCWSVASTFGRIGMHAELAYREEVSR